MLLRCPRNTFDGRARTGRVVPFLLVGCLAACVSIRPKMCTTLVAEPAYSADTVQVAFLGVGGVIVRWQGKAIMTAPLYSNPTVVEMALSEIHVDRQRIDGLMRDSLHDLKDVRAILSGHSHYDHLMDVPYIALHRATNAEVIGNDSMVKLLDPIAKDLDPRKLVSLQKPLANEQLVPGTRFRVRSILSQHSPQFGPRLEGRTARLLAWLLPLPNVSLWRGEDEYPMARLPVRVGEWAGGTTLAYVIELLEPDSDDVAFRIYYQDSSTRPPFGFPPKKGTGDYKYDLAILCLGGATEYHDFPRDIVAHLAPEYVIGVHWEDFFNPRELGDPTKLGVREEIHYAPGVHEKDFLTAVRAAQPSGGRAIVPCPDKTTAFTRTGGVWSIPSGDPDWTKPKP
jgi:hypothetical protein